MSSLFILHWQLFIQQTESRDVHFKIKANDTILILLFVFVSIIYRLGLDDFFHFLKFFPFSSNSQFLGSLHLIVAFKIYYSLFLASYRINHTFSVLLLKTSEFSIIFLCSYISLDPDVYFHQRAFLFSKKWRSCLFFTVQFLREVYRKPPVSLKIF